MELITYILYKLVWLYTIFFLVVLGLDRFMKKMKRRRRKNVETL